MKNILFSIIIPLKKCNQYLDENITAINNGSYKNFEIIVLPDRKEKKKYPKTKIVATGVVGPAVKRDIGAKIAKGSVLAFIDDDAYPSSDWLKHAALLFNKKNCVAVCGPGVTPPGDSLLQKVSGAFSATLLGGGPYTYRFIAQKKRIVDDYPSMNFLIQKKYYTKIGGFDTKFWPGEDTKLCHDLTQIFGQKIYYDPNVLVYHHRRAIFKQHLLQNGRYGLHRGYFARILPKTSFRISYFFPLFLLLGVVLCPVIRLINKPLYFLDVFMLSLYCVLVLGSAVLSYQQNKNLKISLLLIPTIILTHLFYGYKFLEGFFFTASLQSKYNV